METILTARNLRGYYETLTGTVKAVDDVTFSINKGEMLGVTGESGSGKSTLARILMGAIKPPLHLVSGEVKISGKNILKYSPEDLKRKIWGKWISFVPQSSMNALNPTKKLKDFIVDLMRERLDVKLSKDEIIETAGESFRRVGLKKQVLSRYPHELSGGMKQRSVIAISTLLKPKILIADEPTSALDVSSQKLLLKMLVNLKRNKIVQSILYISHDVATLRQICNRCIIMYKGKIVEVGTMEKVVNDPTHPYARKLISSILTLSPTEGKSSRGMSGVFVRSKRHHKLETL